MYKHILLSFLCALCAISAEAVWYDFEYTYEGQTLKYYYVNEQEKTVKVSAGEYKFGAYYPAHTINAQTLVIPSEVVNPEGETCKVVSIGSFAITGSVSSVIIPPTVTIVGDQPFVGCYGILKGVYPNTIVCPFDPEYSNSASYDPEGAFIENRFLYGADKSIIYFAPLNLEGEFEIPETVTEISDYAFAFCRKLTSVKIPENVTRIGKGAFGVCSAVTELEIPDAVNYIGEEAFAAMSALKSIKIPTGITSIKDKTFRECSSLSSVEIPENITSIGAWAFSDCDLRILSLPESITEILEYAFSFNPNLIGVYYNSANPVAADESLFAGKVYTDATLYIPEGALDKFNATAPWNLFDNIREVDFSGVEDVECRDDDSQSAEIFDLSGVRVSTNMQDLPAGAYIVRQGDNTRKILVK